MSKIYKVSFYRSTHYFSSEEVAYRTTAFAIQKSGIILSGFRAEEDEKEYELKLNELYQREDYKAYVETWNKRCLYLWIHQLINIEEIDIDLSFSLTPKSFY